MSDFDYFNEVVPSKFDEWLFQKDPQLVNTIGEFLKNYENLKPIVKDDKTFYVDPQNKPLFYFYQGEKNGYCWFKYINFWEVFGNHYGMEYNEIQEVLKVWLGLTYNLGGLTPFTISTRTTQRLGLTYNLGGLTPSGRGTMSFEYSWDLPII